MTDDRKKGPFWVICNSKFDPDGEESFDFCEANLLAFLVPENAERMPSHRESWEKVWKGDDRDKVWNSFPRGRVELRRGKAVVFLNPVCLGFERLEEEIRKAFALPKEIPVVFKGDASAHYQVEGQCYLPDTSKCKRMEAFERLEASRKNATEDEIFEREREEAIKGKYDGIH